MGRRGDDVHVDRSRPGAEKRHFAAGRDMEVASALAAMADKDPQATQMPASPAWSHSSLASDGTYESAKLDSNCSEGSSSWPSPVTQCSYTSSFSGDTSGDKLLPRLPELDLISLETLASHYASSRNSSRNNSFSGSAASTTSSIHSQLIPHPSSFYKPQSQSHPFPSLSARTPDIKPLRFRHKRNPPTKGTRCNIKYTIEQKDFIDYWRIDRQDRETPWDDVVREFNRQFKGPHRRNGGLQSAYYRENKKIPVADRDGLLVFNESGELKTIEVPVREAKGKLHSIKSIGLLSTHPERAIRYPWVSHEHKMRVWRVAHARQAQLDAAMRKQAELEARLLQGQKTSMGADHLTLPSIISPA